jgi:hypothetical protein
MRLSGQPGSLTLRYYDREDLPSNGKTQQHDPRVFRCGLGLLDWLIIAADFTRLVPAALRTGVGRVNSERSP